MLSIIVSNLQNILVGAVLCGIFILLVIRMAKNRKKGSCCGCSSCSVSDFCHPSSKK